MYPDNRTFGRPDEEGLARKGSDCRRVRRRPYRFVIAQPLPTNATPTPAASARSPWPQLSEVRAAPHCSVVIVRIRGRYEHNGASVLRLPDTKQRAIRPFCSQTNRRPSSTRRCASVKTSFSTVGQRIAASGGLLAHRILSIWADCALTPGSISATGRSRLAVSL